MVFVSLGSVWGKVFFLSRSNRGGGTSPFVHKSFPNIRGMMLGGQIVSRWRWVGQSWAGDVAPSLEISVEPQLLGTRVCNWAGDGHKLRDGTVRNKISYRLICPV